MKIQTAQMLLFSLVLSGMGCAAADLTPGETQAKSLSQPATGHAPHPPLGCLSQIAKSTRLLGVLQHLLCDRTHL